MPALVLCLLLAMFALTAGHSFGQPAAILKGPSALSPEVQVASISATDLAKLMREPRLVIFDTRSKAEFDVSHLRGAMRLDPDADLYSKATIAFIVRHARGKPTVFYCTTSGRSAKLAETIYLTLLDAGVANVTYLRNGLIGWANANGALVDHKGRPTRFVHTYDAETAKLLRDPSRARYGEKL